MTNWYALHIASNYERKVQERLQFQGIEELTPFWIPDPKRISRFTKKPIERALFPGYVFGHFDGQHTSVLRIPGVIQVLSIDREPVPVPESDIENIRRLLAAPELLRPCPEATPNLIEGDAVEVIHGPLAGLGGHVTYFQNRARVVIWIRTMNSGVSAEVAAGDLERIGRREHSQEAIAA